MFILKLSHCMEIAKLNLTCFVILGNLTSHCKYCVRKSTIYNEKWKTEKKGKILQEQIVKQVTQHNLLNNLILSRLLDFYLTHLNNINFSKCSIKWKMACKPTYVCTKSCLPLYILYVKLSRFLSRRL